MYWLGYKKYKFPQNQFFQFSQFSLIALLFVFPGQSWLAVRALTSSGSGASCEMFVPGEERGER